MIKRIINQYKSYIRDFGLSFLSSCIVTAVTTLLVNPLLVQMFDIGRYGSILTICGYIAITSTAIGNALNNVRLLDPNNESGQGLCNYNALLLIFACIGTAVILGLTTFYIKCSTLERLLLCIYMLLVTANMYYIVSFRIKIHFVHNLIYNIIVSVGYVIGLGLCYYTRLWPLVYIFGQLFGFVYILFVSELPKESLKTDNALPDISKKFILLAGTSLLGQALSLLDRLMLHPMVGEEAVSLFSTAAFFGKGIGVLFGPIAFVLLSYFAKGSFIMSKKVYHKIIAVGFAVSLAAFIVSVPLAPLLTKFLYPTIYPKASEFILIANFGYIMSSYATLLGPIILKTCKISWQPVIQGCYGVVYVGLGLLLTSKYGIWGFAYASVAAKAGRVLLLLVLGEMNTKADLV